jgi:aspartate/methionine/tyrosine aminotransferase
LPYIGFLAAICCCLPNVYIPVAQWFKGTVFSLLHMICSQTHPTFPIFAASIKKKNKIMKHPANIDHITGSHISYFSTLVKTHGGINLAQGIPGFQPPERLLEILAEALPEFVHQYAPPTGNLMLLERLDEMYAGRYNPETSRFFVVNGATEAISLIYTYLNRSLGDRLKVLAFSPAYESYIHLPKIFGNPLVCQNLNADGSIDLPALERTIDEENITLMFISSPGNPWGIIPDRATMQAVSELCERKRCYLIIDAVYSEIWFGNEQPWYPTTQLSPWVFFVNSFSKLLSVTGWRLGYFLTHHFHFQRLKEMHDYIGLCSPAPFQEAIARYLMEPEDVIRYTESLRSRISSNYRVRKAQLETHGFSIPHHQGGYFIWARCPEHILSGVRFAVDLYNHYRTAIIPGKHFGDAWDQYIRINMAMPEEVVDAGVNAICEAIEKNLS